MIFQDMLSVLARLSQNLAADLNKKDHKIGEKNYLHMVDIAAESFRCMRNACAGCKKNQEDILRLECWAVMKIAQL